MSAHGPSTYQDHYQVLGLPQKATTEAVQEAYQELAARYHPKNRDTGNKDKFAAVNIAYEVLSDPTLRKQHDDSLGGGFQDDAPKFHSGEFFLAVGSEVQRRLCLLCLLYDRRRFKPATGSLSLRDLENLMAITQDQLQLTIWYLKQRGLICSNDKSSLQITVEGMDYLEKNLPPADSILALLRATAEPQPAPTPSTP
jgi:curved DNA-binding protein CbpA